MSRVVAVRSKLLGPTHSTTLTARLNLAMMLMKQGKHKAAIAESKELAGLFERVLGPMHVYTLSARNNLGAALLSERSFAEAENEFRKTLELKLRAFGTGHPESLRGYFALAGALQMQNKLEEAIRVAQQGLTGVRVNSPDCEAEIDQLAKFILATEAMIKVQPK